MPDPSHAIQAAQAVQQATDGAIDGTIMIGGGTGLATVIGGLWLKLNQVFNKTIPRIVRDFDERLAKQQDVFLKLIADQRNEIREQRSDFLAELKQDRTDGKAVTKELASAIDRLDNTIRSQQRTT